VHHKADWPVIVLFHGSRVQEANTKARVLVKRLAAEMPGRTVEVAFLSQANPSLAQAISLLAAANPRKITVMPAFLLPGSHVTQDIEAAIAEAKKDHPVQKVIVAEPIGACPELIAILMKRIDDVDAL